MNLSDIYGFTSGRICYSSSKWSFRRMFLPFLVEAGVLTTNNPSITAEMYKKYVVILSRGLKVQ